jgi:endonuclease/exonuclease/phosphatase family metal-dependent hydrolase
VLDRALDLLGSRASGEVVGRSSNRWTVASFRLASSLTDPVCHFHERYRRIAIVDALHPHAPPWANMARKLSLLAGLLGYAVLATVTTAPGIALRSLASRWQETPYLYGRGEGPEKTLPVDRVFSILSWNVCCVGGGYPISDGGVLPWPARIEGIVDEIRRHDADVVCLYETFDARAAFYLRDKMLDVGYVHCYYNIAPRGLGVNSGILVASKYGIQSPEFTPFPAETLVGRTRSATKGVFGFDVHSGRQCFARVYVTHLQHSEECMYPTLEERAGRAAQMQIVVDRVDAALPACTVVTGDLNLDDEEYRASAWQHRFQKGDTYRDPRRTWGGDAFCATLVGKRVSAALNLDHTMLATGTGRTLRTSLVDPGYDALRFRREALSDHGALLSEISV